MTPSALCSAAISLAHVLLPDSSDIDVWPGPVSETQGNLCEFCVKDAPALFFKTEKEEEEEQEEEAERRGKPLPDTPGDLGT